jgi:hypothetical protein
LFWLVCKNAQLMTKTREHAFRADAPRDVNTRNRVLEMYPLYGIHLRDNSINGNTLWRGAGRLRAVWHGFGTIFERRDHLPWNEGIQPCIHQVRTWAIVEWLIKNMDKRNNWSSRGERQVTVQYALMIKQVAVFEWNAWYHWACKVRLDSNWKSMSGQ